MRKAYQEPFDEFSNDDIKEFMAQKSSKSDYDYAILSYKFI